MRPALRRLTAGAAFAALGVQAVYLTALRRGFRRTVRPAPAPSAQPLPPITVVVAARNEARRLPHLLDALAGQTHPSVDVVVVDDGSTDATAAVVEARQAAWPRLHLVRQPPEGKKAALARGIAAAPHPLLAFTDADAAPPPGWLERIARHHAAAWRPTVVIGYGPYRAHDDALGRFVRYETLTTAWLAAAAIGLGRPYMAVGRNLSYPRALFERVGGFAAHRHLRSGDDDLFVQTAARCGARVVYLSDPATYVPTEAPRTWRAWLRQKRRHTSAGRAYEPAVQRHLALYHGSSTLLWLAPFAAGAWGAGALGLRLLLHRRVLSEAAAVLGEADLLPRHALLELGYAAYNVAVAPLGLLRPPSAW